MATLHLCLAALALLFRSIPKLIRPGFHAPAAEAAECAVCLSEIGEAERVSRKLKCKHVFHKRCLDQWVDEHGGRTCPVCRGRLSGHGKKSEADAGAVAEDMRWREESTIVFSPFSGFGQEDSWWLR